MKAKAGKVSAIALAVAMVATLSFGARAAFAEPAMMDCPNDGWNTLGACLTNEECTANCQSAHGDPNVIGQCHLGCCRCLF